MTEKGLEIQISADGEQARRSVQDVAELAGKLCKRPPECPAQAATN